MWWAGYWSVCQTLPVLPYLVLTIAVQNRCILQMGNGGSRQSDILIKFMRFLKRTAWIQDQMSLELLPVLQVHTSCCIPHGAIVKITIGNSSPFLSLGRSLSYSGMERLSFFLSQEPTSVPGTLWMLDNMYRENKWMNAFVLLPITETTTNWVI